MERQPTATDNIGAKRSQQTADRLPHHNENRFAYANGGCARREGGNDNVGEGRPRASTKCEPNYTELYRTKAN